MASELFTPSRYPPAKLHHEIINVTAIRTPLCTLSLWSFSFQLTCHFRLWCRGVCASWPGSTCTICQEKMRYAGMLLSASKTKWFLLSLLHFPILLPFAMRNSFLVLLPGSSFHKDFRAVPLPRATRPTNDWRPWRVHSSRSTVWQNDIFKAMWKFGMDLKQI